MFPDETELKFSITNIMDELKGNVRLLEKKKVLNALINELKISPSEKRERYNFLSLAGAERNNISVVDSNSITYLFRK